MSLSRALRVPEPKRPQFPGPQSARVLEVRADGTLLVEPVGDPGTVWGPARWGPRRGGHVPPAGTLCLVQHAGLGLSEPWVTALDWAVPDAP